MADFDAPLGPQSAGSTGPSPARRRSTASSEAISFFAGVPATVWMTDPDLRLTFVEGQLLRRLKITSDRIIGRTLHDLLLDGREDHPLIHGHLTALGGHETNVRIEWGGEVYSARLGPLRDQSGHIVGVVGVHQQIAWLPDDDGTLRESDIRLRRAMDANLIGIAFGNEDGQITDANDAFLELAGYTREDLTTDGISWPVLVPVEFHQLQMNAIEQVKQTGRCKPFESELIRSDGRRVQVLVGGARLSAQRREGVAFVMDISKSSRATRGLRAELACADALLMPDRSAAPVRTLQLLCDQLGWRGASLWPPQTAVPAHGTVWPPDAVLNVVARRAVATGGMEWSEVSGVLAVPLPATSGGTSVLLVLGTPGQTPDAETTASTVAIALRLARTL